MASVPNIPDKSDLKNSVYLWLFLWVMTLIHAGLMVGSILASAKFPPGYEIPPNWLPLLGPGASPASYWFYIGVLGANILSESSYKGPKTYVRSSFPFPDFLYSHVAVAFWTLFNLFAHIGSANGWFTYPNQLSHTFWSCLGLWFAQHLYMKYLNDPEAFKKEFEDEPKPAKAETPKPVVQALNPTLPVTASNKSVSNNAELTDKVLDYVRQNGQAKTSGLVGVLGSSKRTVIRNLNKLLADGKLIREGSGQSAVYRLNDNPKDGKWN